MKKNHISWDRHHNSIREEDQDKNNGTSEGCNYNFWRNCDGNSKITIGKHFLTLNEEAENYLGI